MIRPALRDWQSIFASVQKYFTRVSQGKTRREMELAAVHGGNVKFWAGSRDVASGNWAARWGLSKNQFARTFYPGAPHKYVLAMQGRRTCIMTWFKGLAKYFCVRAKILCTSFARQNSQEAGARRRPWRQRESFGLVLGMKLLGIGLYVGVWTRTTRKTFKS